MSDAADPVPERPRVTVQTLCLIILTTLAVFRAMSVGAEIVVPLLLAAVLKLLLQPAMRFLCDKLRFPAAIAALLLMVAMFGVLTGIGLAIAVPASGWIQKLPQGLQTLQDRLSILRDPIDGVRYALNQIEQMTQHGTGENLPAVAAQAGNSASKVEAMGISVLLGAEYFIGRFFVLLVVLFFMLAAGDSMLRRLVEVIPAFRDKKHLVFISNEIERNVSGYLQTITVVNAVVGILNGLALYALGVSDPLLWGTMAFLLNFIPIVGPVVGICITMLVGLLSFNTLAEGVVPACIYLLIHIGEGQILTPMLLARRFTLNPVILIVSLFFWNWLWGVPGALLSVPILAIIKIICDRIPSLAALGHLLGTSPRPQTSRELAEAA